MAKKAKKTAKRAPKVGKANRRLSKQFRQEFRKLSGKKDIGKGSG